MPTFTDVTEPLNGAMSCEPKNAGTHSGHRRCINEQSQVTFWLSRSVFLLRSFLDLQFHEFIENLFAVITGLHF